MADGESVSKKENITGNDKGKSPSSEDTFSFSDSPTLEDM